MENYKQPRSCYRVIQEILKVIPENIYDGDLQRDLKNAKQIAKYSSPEDFRCWKVLQMIIDNFLSNPNNEWEWEVLSIFTDRSIEELKGE